MISYISVCSGIEAATCAWHPLGWRPLAFAEIEKFPAAVLATHYPNVPNYGDLTRFNEWPDVAADAVVGGTPCQAFSLAGLRKGLDDPRGNLTLTFLALVRKSRARWVVWENVPGVLSDRTNAFGQFLAGLGELGYGWAYRVLDAQYFGVAQRRRRVFVVANLGDWRRAAAVLFEPESMRGDSPPRRQSGQRVAGTLTRSALDGSSPCGGDGREGSLVAHSLRAEGFDASEDGTGRGIPLVPAISPTLLAQGNATGGDRPPGTTVDTADSLIPIAFSAKDYGADAGDIAPTLRAGGHTKSHQNGGVMPAVAFDTTQITSAVNRCNPQPGDPCHPLARGAHAPAVAFNWQGGGNQTTLGANSESAATLSKSTTQAIAGNMVVRRLTPRECERLQGFPDDYTRIMYRGKLAADGPRYKALGNSMAVPVMRWIGQRIAIADTL